MNYYSELKLWRLFIVPFYSIVYLAICFNFSAQLKAIEMEFCISDDIAVSKVITLQFLHNIAKQ